jgi:hypothetical protein
MKLFLRTQFGVVLYGLAFWLPVAILVFVVTFLIGYVEDSGRSLFVLVFPADYFHWGFGTLLAFILLYISGLVFKLTKMRRLLSKIPKIGPFIGGGEVITVDRLSHLAPCLFMMSPTCLSYGWILSEEKVRLADSEAMFTLLNVYYPNVPTMITGQVFPIRKDSVMKLGNTTRELFDLLLYTFRSPEAIRYLPWENESEIDFKKRAASFGINIGSAFYVQPS